MTIYVVKFGADFMPTKKYYYGIETALAAVEEYMKINPPESQDKIQEGEWIEHLTESPFYDPKIKRSWTFRESNQMWSDFYCYFESIDMQGDHPITLRNIQLEQENAKLKQTIEELRYFPGGPGYQEALADWESRSITQK